MQPIIQNKPFQRYILLALVIIVSFVLFLTSALGNITGNDPNTSIAAHPSSPDTVTEPGSVSEPGSAPGQIQEHQPTPEPVKDSVCPLTGLPMEETKTRNRPLAISLSNVPEALPMNGVSQADIIYEVLIESGHTRLLGIFQDFSGVPKVGSIRSARHYTAEIAHSYNAIFITAGGSPLGYKEIREQGITHLDEVGGSLREIFYRDRLRVSGMRFESLHSVVITNDRVMRWFPEYDFKLVHDEAFDQGLIFIEDGTPVHGGNAVEISVDFSSHRTTSFTYDPDEKVYHMRHFNRDFIDANNDERPAFTNIFIIKTSITGIPGDSDGRRDIVTIGSGEGYFICGGRYIEINWSRADKDAPYVYTHKDGTPLELGRGKSYICIIPTNMNASFN